MLQRTRDITETIGDHYGWFGVTTDVLQTITDDYGCLRNDCGHDADNCARHGLSRDVRLAITDNYECEWNEEIHCGDNCGPLQTPKSDYGRLADD